MATRTATVVKSKSKAIAPRAASKVSKTQLPTKIVAKIKDDVDEMEASENVAPKTRRKVKPEVRTRIYWGVFNQSLKRVAVFEFDQKGEAEKRAVKLHKTSGELHFIQKLKAIVQ